MWEVNVINKRNDSAGVLSILMKYCVFSVAAFLSSVPHGLKYCSSKF